MEGKGEGWAQRGKKGVTETSEREKYRVPVKMHSVLEYNFFNPTIDQNSTNMQGRIGESSTCAISFKMLEAIGTT